jgi:hypothetical protein
MTLKAWVMKQIFPQTEMKEVAAAEVKKLVNENCNTLEMADQIFDYGIAISSETLQNTAQLDAKGISVLGFAGALLAFLLAAQENLEKAGWARWPYGVLLFFAELSAILAILRAFLSMRVRLFSALSETDWFQPKLLTAQNPARLRRFYARTIHSVNQVSGRINSEKSAQLDSASKWLAVSALLIGLLLVLRQGLGLLVFLVKLIPVGIRLVVVSLGGDCHCQIFLICHSVMSVAFHLVTYLR